MHRPRSHLSICFCASLESLDADAEAETPADDAELCADHSCSLRPAFSRPWPVSAAALPSCAFVALAAFCRLACALDASAAGSILIDGAEAAESRFCCALALVASTC